MRKAELAALTIVMLSMSTERPGPRTRPIRWSAVGTYVAPTSWAALGAARTIE